MNVKTGEIKFLLPDKEIKLKIVSNVEALITDLEDEDKVPCWAEIWPAAEGAARWIWNNLFFEQGESMLELGSGLGLAGIICGLKGAKVTFSDYIPGALELASENAANNGVKDFNVFLGDWRQFNINQTFDWILCSDVTYDPKLNVYLLDILDNYLAENGSILVAHPGRSASFGFMQDIEKIAQWEKNNIKFPVTVIDAVFPCQDVYIHHWKKK
ncbi:MAG: methyltransferase domain-containing protein [Clostridiales bacterium]|nr:methyltransferase domain-containing protein [Clostridiales bacterium]MCF8021655.1 methyltransferase domain-containing protein [Clostridiales bacterium]